MTKKIKIFKNKDFNYLKKVPVTGRYKFGARVQVSNKVKIKKLKDGFGREDVYAILAFSFNGKSITFKYSCKKYGEENAKMLCSLDRMKMFIQLGIWRMEDGDLFKNLNFSDSFKSEDYKDCKIEYQEYDY